MNSNLEMYNEYLCNVDLGKENMCYKFFNLLLLGRVYFKLITKNANNNDKHNM